jgi:hypothetical protein
MKAIPELKRLEKLIGRWKLSGRTLDSMIENITGLEYVRMDMRQIFHRIEG